jgi:rhodanese-related sulfurtransferase
VLIAVDDPSGRPVTDVCIMESVMPQQQVPFASVDEIPADAAVLDVREPDEWVAGHIEGATHIPMGDVPARLDDLPEGDPLYVACRASGRSARVAAWLNANGFDAVVVAGGMGVWVAAGRPLVSETGRPAYIV